MSEKPQRGAVLQFEIDRTRWVESTPAFNGEYGDNPMKRLRFMVKTAVCDTVNNGGTFVLVVTADKVTMIQRPDAEEI